MDLKCENIIRFIDKFKITDLESSINYHQLENLDDDSNFEIKSS